MMSQSKHRDPRGIPHSGTDQTGSHTHIQHAPQLEQGESSNKGLCVPHVCLRVLQINEPAWLFVAANQSAIPTRASSVDAYLALVSLRLRARRSCAGSTPVTRSSRRCPRRRQSLSWRCPRRRQSLGAVLPSSSLQSPCMSAMLLYPSGPLGSTPVTRSNRRCPRRRQSLSRRCPRQRQSLGAALPSSALQSPCMSAMLLCRLP